MDGRIFSFLMDGRIFICFKFYQYIHKREIKYTYIQILCDYFWEQAIFAYLMHEDFS